MNRKAVAAVAGLALLALAAAGWYFRADRVYTEQLYAMDTVMGFTAYGPHGRRAVKDAVKEIQRLDALLSTGSADSEVSRLNRDGGGAVSEDTARLLDAAGRVYTDTGGLFDCTIYPLMGLWGFPTGDYHVPEAGELAAVLPLVDQSRLRYGGGEAALGEGQQIDFGGIAKGYAAERVIEIFQERGVESGMVSLGGNVQTLGTKPDGSPWRIGVRDPEGAQGSYLAVLPVEDRAVVTSGGYERYFEQDGKTYIHILDPRTGRPAESDLLSVTVVSKDGTAADGLSTALYIMGLEGAADFWRSRAGQFDLVLVAADGSVYITEGVQDGFQTERPYVLLKEKAGKRTFSAYGAACRAGSLRAR